MDEVGVGMLNGPFQMEKINGAFLHHYASAPVKFAKMRFRYNIHIIESYIQGSVDRTGQGCPRTHWFRTVDPCLYQYRSRLLCFLDRMFQFYAFSLLK